MIRMTDQSGNVYGIYDERQMAVSLRRYKIIGPIQDTSLTARVRRACIPLQNETDQSDINNIGALEEALRAVHYYDNVDYEKAGAAMRTAIWLLNGEYARYQPETELGAAQLDPGSGCGSIGNIL